MFWLWLIGTALILCFGFVLLFGAPYVPTLTPQVTAALQLAALQPGQHMLELGCGDGKVLITAAQAGIYVTGYELNPVMALISWLRTRRYKKYVTVVWGDFWKAKWPEVDTIFTFLHPRFMQKLDNKIVQYKHKPVKLVSFAFAVPERKPNAVKKGVFLYVYL